MQCRVPSHLSGGKVHAFGQSLASSWCTACTPPRLCLLYTKAEILMPFRQGPSWPPFTFWLRWLNPSLLHMAISSTTGTELPLQLASLKTQLASQILTANFSLFVGHFWSWQVLLCLSNTEQYKACPHGWALKLLQWFPQPRSSLVSTQLLGSWSQKKWQTEKYYSLQTSQITDQLPRSTLTTNHRWERILREDAVLKLIWGHCPRKKQHSGTVCQFPKPKKMDTTRKINKTEDIRVLTC